MLSWILLSSLLISQTFDAETITDTKGLMDMIVIPASDVVFRVVVDPPQDEMTWAVIESNAALLAESGNQLLSWSEGREPWIDASRALIAASEATVEAAREMELDRFLDLGDMILVSCSNCHDVYLE